MYFSMDGVFLRRTIQIICAVLFVVGLTVALPGVEGISVFSDGKHLFSCFLQPDKLAELEMDVEHFVNSFDHAIKSAVDVQQAKVYLQSHLPKIQSVTNSMLQNLGLEDGKMTEYFSSLFSSSLGNTSLLSIVYQTVQILFQNFFHSDS